MKPYYEEPNAILYQGHALDVLKVLSLESVDCVITSPPYWGLRAYKTEPIVWDDHSGCEHEWGKEKIVSCGRNDSGDKGGALFHGTSNISYAGDSKASQGNFCLKCGAWRGELGLEPTIELYVSHLLQIFDEVKRVLKKTGTLWVNIGDSYAGGQPHKAGETNPGKEYYTKDTGNFGTVSKQNIGIPAKSLCLIPERFALGMVERGWILRNNIIWYKPNPMPESVKDRFTGTYEYLYFFTKTQRYWFEQQFEPHDDKAGIDRFTAKAGISRQDYEERKWTDRTDGLARPPMTMTDRNYNPLGRNKRDVWEINTQPYPEAHFAVFPEKLVETPILAGCPSAICKRCGKARERVYEKTGHINKRERAHCPNNCPTKVDSTSWALTERPTEQYTDCGCGQGFEPGVVIDIFAGSGTTGAVVKRLGRKYIGIELSENYCKLQRKRLQAVPLAMDLI